MRPRGEIREALASAFHELSPTPDVCAFRGAVAHQGVLDDVCAGVTWRDAAVHAQVGFDAARQTVRDMHRAGELVTVGTARRAHANRPMVLYAPAPGASEHAAASVELSNAINGWAQFP